MVNNQEDSLASLPFYLQRYGFIAGIFVEILSNNLSSRYTASPGLNMHPIRSSPSRFTFYPSDSNTKITLPTHSSDTRQQIRLISHHCDSRESHDARRTSIGFSPANRAHRINTTMRAKIIFRLLTKIRERCAKIKPYLCSSKLREQGDHNHPPRYKHLPFDFAHACGLHKEQPM